jgi:hypothetical protein
MQATSRDLREREKRQNKIANDRTWKSPVLRPACARALAATWVTMRLKSGNAGDSFWPEPGVPARIQSQSCSRARFAADIFTPVSYRGKCLAVDIRILPWIIRTTEIK